ncbi:hypothetical protein ACC695_40195, partial [Rhizobium ruizarguesonis]
PGFQMLEKHDWLGTGICYHVGVDGISMLFVILSTFLMPFCVLASWLSIEKRLKEYMIAFLILEKDVEQHDIERDEHADH